MSLSLIQAYLKSHAIDGWLVYDFQMSNAPAMQVLKLSSDDHLTRPFYYWVPQEGTPHLFLHKIETHLFSHLEGERHAFLGYRDLVEKLQVGLGDAKKVMMEISSLNQIPYLSKVPSGVVDLVRSFGIEVVESSDLLNELAPRWDETKLAAHRRAAQILQHTYEEAHEQIKQALEKGEKISEAMVERFIAKSLEDRNLVFDAYPNCSVNANAANPHYQCEGEGAIIERGDLVLIDLWGRENQEHSPNADITVMAIAGNECTKKERQVFDVVRKAQRAAFELIESRFKAGEAVTGAEADRAARRQVIDAGFGDFFIHRTGHNLDVKLHGDGTHLDSYETVDERKLLAGTCFTIEPGIYLPKEFGVRLEADVYIHHDRRVEMTTPSQDDYYFLF